jgi:hypothetical protein
MPYFGESAKNQGNQRLMADIGIKEVLKQIQFISSVNEYVRLDNYVVTDIPKAKNSDLEYIFVIDGSKFETQVGDKKEVSVGLLSINQCAIDMKKMVTYLGNSFALPKEYQEIKEDITMNAFVPLKGLKGSESGDEKDLFRLFFYKVVSHAQNKINQWLKDRNYQADYQETLLDTYLHLVGKLTKLNTSMIAPCSECKKAGHSIGIKTFKSKEGVWSHTAHCKCQIDPKTYYVTDLLQFYEQFNNESSTEALTTQMMLVLERLTLINLLRNLQGNELTHLLEHSAFVLDGSLAIYSHASWFSGAIAEEIFSLKNNYKLLIMGIEKTGNFVEHFKKVDSFYQEDSLKKGLLYFLNDDYIKRYVKVYHNDSFYGEKNYFGKKLFYKNKLGKLFVVNLAFEDEGDKFLYFNQRNDEDQIAKIQRLEHLVMLLENFSSQAYPNALSFISMANDGASLSSSHMGRKLLQEFAEELLENQTA